MLKGHLAPVYGCAVNHDASCVITSGSDSTISIWHLTDPDDVGVSAQSEEVCRSAALTLTYSTNPLTVALATNVGTVYLGNSCAQILTLTSTH